MHLMFLSHLCFVFCLPSLAISSPSSDSLLSSHQLHSFNLSAAVPCHQSFSPQYLVSRFVHSFCQILTVTVLVEACSWYLCHVRFVLGFLFDMFCCLLFRLCCVFCYSFWINKFYLHLGRHSGRLSPTPQNRVNIKERLRQEIEIKGPICLFKFLWMTRTSRLCFQKSGL